MDSLTQIVLGAAVGELCQGRKLGNRAMIWGAVAGTIPDLDVFSRLWVDELGFLESHRGISHSLFFAVLAPLFIAYYTYWFYNSAAYKNKTFKRIAFGAAAVFLPLCLVVPVVITNIFSSGGTYITGAIMLALVGVFVYRWYHRYLKDKTYDFENLSYEQWYWFFLWTIITHPLLDCFTVYGTQIFLPFSNTRVSWDNIAVVDPAYTLPFLFCLIVASFYHRHSKTRMVWNTLGIVISGLYMALTFVHKNQVNKALEKAMAIENIVPTRYMNNPTMINNFLWTAAVETDSMVYTGRYSIFDKQDYFTLFKHKKDFNFARENHYNYTYNILNWFSDGYYWVREDSIGKYSFYDLRYGMTDDEGNVEENGMAKKLVKNESRILHLANQENGSSRDLDAKTYILDLIKRAKGI